MMQPQTLVRLLLTVEPSAMTLVGGTLADCWKAEERGVPMAVFSAAPFIGPAVSSYPERTSPQVESNADRSGALGRTISRRLYS